MPGTRFEEALRRLLHIARARIRSGETSERRLALLAGFSQPHLHNLLAGKRALRPGTADRLLAVLALTLEDLLASRAPPGPDAVVPWLTGPVGGGRAFPAVSRDPPAPFFDRALAAGVAEPVLTRLAQEETAMRPTLNPGDYLLLDCSPAARQRPSAAAVYALDWQGRSYVRRCRLVRDALVPQADAATPAALPARLPLEGGRVDAVLRAQVVWFGRSLRGL